MGSTSVKKKKLFPHYKLVVLGVILTSVVVVQLKMGWREVVFWGGGEVNMITREPV